MLKFAHTGACQDELESTTSAALRHVLDSTAAQGTKHRLPLEYKARDPGMGLKKLDPERQQGNSTNFFEWAPESIPSSEDGLTIYQTSFVTEEDTQNSQSSCFRRYPKHHTKNWCHNKPVPENDKDLQPDKSSEA
ncbi:testis expressed 36 [Willisornis vidua]|uniref:Testis expressed 36 n=1 Tax=Willisornis vidua TaxID=1566151 RepID=A0ABQ9CSD4_9PASS|nr:testis expressed 36 [Willisornis vidua]